MGVRVAVAGASGYAGGELLRLIAGHPDLELGPVTAGTNAGAAVTALHPHLAGLADRTFEDTDPDRLAAADLVFLALHHEESARLAARLPADVPVIDLSASFRLSDPGNWTAFYRTAHAGRWVYGLPELPGARGEIAAARRVAAPGCYATAIILALTPLLASGVAEPADIVVVAASGTSGAGRTPTHSLLATEVMGSVSGYQVGGVHRHTPEIEQAFAEAAGVTPVVSFTPLLAPMPRGILATCTARLAPAAGAGNGRSRAARPTRVRRARRSSAPTRGSRSSTCCPKATGPAPRRPSGPTRCSCRQWPTPTRGGPWSCRPWTTWSRGRPAKRSRSPTSCSACQKRPALPPTESHHEPCRRRYPGNEVMSVTAPLGFRAAGVAAGLKASGERDVAVVINDGPSRAAAAVFTRNRVKAAPVLWTQQVVAGGRVRAVALNSGGANACTGPLGFPDTHATAERLAVSLAAADGTDGESAGEIAVCSTGLIGERLPMDLLLGGLDAALGDASRSGGTTAADAIRTTDTVSKIAFHRAPRVHRRRDGQGGGHARPGPGHHAVRAHHRRRPEPGRAGPGAARGDPGHLRPAGHRRLHVHQRHRAAAGQRRRRNLARRGRFAAVLTEVCTDLARQLQADAEGASKLIAVEVVGAASEADAVTAGRAVARSNLLKCAIAGEDPNWGRVLSAVGTTDAAFEPERLSVAINGVWVCRNGCAGDDRSKVDMHAKNVTITVDLSAGPHAATISTTDLTAAYVHENSAYST